jgi:hypothetical protein
MANPWFRLYAECADDFKMSSMPEAMRWRYVALMCLQCSEQLKGLPDAGVAFKLRISLAEVAETKELFTRLGFIEGNWDLTNWEKRQFLSDSNAGRQKAYRERKALAKKTLKKASEVT